MAHFVSPADAKVWQQARDATKAFRNKDALALYQKLVKKNPQHGVLWYELGSSAKKMLLLFWRDTKNWFWNSLK